MQVASLNSTVSKSMVATGALRTPGHRRGAEGAVQHPRSGRTVQQAAEQLIASTFYLPMLQSMRDDPFRSELMHGGYGEDAFAGMLDQELADRMARRDATGLVDMVSQRFLQAHRPAAGKTNPRGLDQYG
jgi:Rod binding domain-containing protein